MYVDELPRMYVELCIESCLLKFKHVSKFESFEGLKVGAQISALKPILKTDYSVLRVGLRALVCADCFGSSKS
jgi:hypothetical protein